jgi:lysyl-tRNA synthetase, class II
MGKITFLNLQDSTGNIQIYAAKNTLKNYEILKLLDVGDWIGTKGILFKTKTGELTINLQQLTVLSKSLRPLPEKWHGLKDKEKRYRKRYLDLIMSPEVQKVFRQRALIIQTIREFLDTKDFLEVETPAIHQLYGGTNAKPFKTHINAFKQDVYMRLAPELYLKRLIVGGLGKVYELGKNFRNEGADLQHNPEFTMIEFYESYADYHTMMDTAEAMYKVIAKTLYGNYKIPRGKNFIDLSGKWPRQPMTDAIQQHLKIDVETMSVQELKKVLQKNKVKAEDTSKGVLMFTIFDKLVAPTLKNPTWIIDYPKEVSPLAKPHRTKKGFVERFECYAAGFEIGDGWSEIIDPVEQRERFEGEQKQLRKDKEEAHPVDEEFLEAMEYGMPVLGGIGIGIDRLTMFFTDKESIRDVLFFPFMKPN